MSHDDYMAGVLKIYEQTAEKLYKQEKVTEDEMRQYHGITGMMMARIVAALWTKEELERQIDARLKLKCAECRAVEAAAAAGGEQWYVRVIILLTPWRWAVAVACFSPVLPSVLDKAGELMAKF